MRQNSDIINIIQGDQFSSFEQMVGIISEKVSVSKEVATHYLNAWRRREDVTITEPIRFVIEPAKLRPPIVDDADLPLLPEEGKVQGIIRLHDSGKSNDEIIALGFNKSTVYRQVSEHRKRKKAKNQSNV